MKTLILFTLVVVFIVFSPGLRAEDKERIMTMWMGTSKIQGSILWRSDVRTAENGSTKSCKVGFITDRDKGPIKRKFLPILTLPPIDNDTYVIDVVDDSLLVTTTKTGKIIVELNLQNLDPALLDK